MAGRYDAGLRRRGTATTGPVRTARLVTGAAYSLRSGLSDDCHAHRQNPHKLLSAANHRCASLMLILRRLEHDGLRGAALARDSARDRRLVDGQVAKFVNRAPSRLPPWRLTARSPVLPETHPRLTASYDRHRRSRVVSPRLAGRRRVVFGCRPWARARHGRQRGSASGS